jgi:hypothetical protein
MKKYYWLKYVESRINHKNSRCYTETRSEEKQILIDQTPLFWLVIFNEKGKEIRNETTSWNNKIEEVSYKAELVDWKEISEEDFNLFDDKCL